MSACPSRGSPLTLWSQLFLPLVLRETVVPLRVIGGVMILAAIIVLAKSELDASRARTLEDEEYDGRQEG